MKKIVMLFLFAVAMMAQNAEAQTKKKPTSKTSASARAANERAKKEKEKTKAKEEKNKTAGSDTNKFGKEFWTTKMMYGSYINYPYFGNGIFNMALSPMIAYKITPDLAAGVITKFNYIWQRSSTPNEAPLQVVDLGIGVFARAKILRVVLLHAEYERTNYSTAAPNVTPLKIVKVPETSANLGIGYISGFGTWKYEIGFYYDVLFAEKNKLGQTFKRNPFEYRAAITYNF